LERGTSLIVLARFGGVLPQRVELVLDGLPGPSNRVELVKSLADPVFGGSVAEVQSNLIYHVEYGSEGTRQFKVTVFEHPRLEKSDADLVFPEYTGLEKKHIPDTKRISAVEGSTLSLALQLNKPVAAAKLVPREKGGETISLVLSSNRAAASLSSYPLQASQTYDLRLSDEEGRTNKVAAQFVFDVLKNREPELRLAAPRGDLRPSPLEEIAFEGTVWDDFGVKAFGLGYARGGKEPEFLELGQAVPAKQKYAFRHLLRLEDIGLEPDQLVSWFVWADDVGPDGTVRRTVGDLFFAEIRPFEEVFREGQGSEGQPQSGAGGEQQQQGSPSSKLAELQKQIISATWKLQRDSATKPVRKPGQTGGTGKASGDQTGNKPEPPGIEFTAVRQRVFGQSSPESPSQRGPRRGTQRPGQPERPGEVQSDLGVVRESQEQAKDQAQEMADRQSDPRSAVLWRTALEQMEKAITQLRQATNSPGSLKDALASEQAAYQALLQVREHEYQVNRSRNQRGSQGSNSMQNQMQRQLEDMELTQTENRYETQRQAQRPPSARRNESLEVMNRLQELARRQQDLNERLKELQTALQEARNEAEREEIRRRLKRLQEEEQQMLADVDEVRQRMDRQENQSRMSQERQQLDQTRQDIQRAAEAAQQGSPSQALASGTRAQRQLQEMRDQMRRENSSQFSEEMREMRSEARELARQQEAVNKQMEDEAAKGGRKSLSDSPERRQTLEQLARQRERMTNLVERATEVSRQSETSEPLLSQQLHDTVRNFTQQSSKEMKQAQNELLSRGPLTPGVLEKLRDNTQPDGAKLLDLASEMLRSDFLPSARDLGGRSRAGIEELRRGVERAAQSVVGDDAEALRQAQRQLDELTRQLENEMAQAGGTNSAASSGVPGESEQQQQQTRANQPATPQNTPSTEGQPGQGQEPQSGSGQLAGDARRQGGNRQAQDRPGTRREGGTGGANTVRGGEGGDLSGSLGRTMDRLFDNSFVDNSGPLTGENFVPWADRLREVEQILDVPELRNDIAAARERARLLRQDFRRDRKKPDWAVVRLQVLKPLVEVRDRITEELARRNPGEDLVPIDRDPVPQRYADLVKKYYEELGKARATGEK
jgi:hypothetical protein